MAQPDIRGVFALDRVTLRLYPKTIPSLSITSIYPHAGPTTGG